MRRRQNTRACAWICQRSLHKMSEYLYRYYGKKVIIHHRVQGEQSQKGADPGGHGPDRPWPDRGDALRGRSAGKGDSRGTDPEVRLCLPRKGSADRIGKFQKNPLFLKYDMLMSYYQGYDRYTVREPLRESSNQDYMRGDASRILQNDSP